jgi:hypothetical protein
MTLCRQRQARMSFADREPSSFRRAYRQTFLCNTKEPASVMRMKHHGSYAWRDYGLRVGIWRLFHLLVVSHSVV